MLFKFYLLCKPYDLLCKPYDRPSLSYPFKLVCFYRSSTVSLHSSPLYRLSSFVLTSQFVDLLLSFLSLPLLCLWSSIIRIGPLLSVEHTFFYFYQILEAQAACYKQELSDQRLLTWKMNMPLLR